MSAQADPRAQEIEDLRRRLGEAQAHIEALTRGRDDSRVLRLNRLYLVLSRVGEAIVRIRDRQELYQRVCRIVVQEGGMQMALIVELDPTSRTVKPVASVGASAQFLGSWKVTVDDGPLGRGTIGTALRTGHFDVCMDFVNDPRMAPWRDGADVQNYRSGASFPIKVGGTTIGALGMFADEAWFFQNDEIELMVGVADDLSFAIESLQKEQQRRWAEAALRASEASMALAQRVGHFGSWELDLQNAEDVDVNPLRWSDEMYRIAGIEPGSVAVDNQLFFRLVPADEHPAIRNAMQNAIAELGTYSIVHRLVRPSGEVRILRETAEVLVDAESGQARRATAAPAPAGERHCGAESRTAARSAAPWRSNGRRRKNNASRSR